MPWVLYTTCNTNGARRVYHTPKGKERFIRHFVRMYRKQCTTATTAETPQ
jgi:hypothetical protein